VSLTTFHLKRGDRLPSLSATLQTVDGVAVDLTGGTVRFLMRRRGQVAKVNAAAVVVVAATGSVRYDWAAADVDTAGDFEGEFEFKTATGLRETFPNDGPFAVIIAPDIGDAP
jgi:hypothetical protein